MTLVPGSRLGPYEINAPLGEGGMGVVCRATDSKLKREVAIKVLPEAFAADADRLARYEREAQVLAKAMDPPAGSASAADLARSPTPMNSPTLTSAHGTQLGVILGTAGYMSPEQARGGAVDRRADIWAFGVILFEMLTARRLFEGDTVSDTLAAVLRQEISWGTLPAATPAPLRRLLRLCLERNPKNRLHDVADARIALDELMSGRTGESTPAGALRPVTMAALGGRRAGRVRRGGGGRRTRARPPGRSSPGYPRQGTRTPSCTPPPTTASDSSSARARARASPRSP